ncbi:hypothetical protein BXZ70DRAFT_83700 [Cristinia sonorae]|uniref:NAD(P)-binding domain-containing protein n=1 Tax=Cristinia sonorae TaxID=1940300 RepID=A0A8K0XR00_9AGAR|nr:hypothetical protein BXZ70DRAFT_83700 [Cristinia sonorae]
MLVPLRPHTRYRSCAHLRTYYLEPYCHQRLEPRQSIRGEHTIIYNDFSSYPSDVASRLAQNDACVWAVGMSASGGVKEADYTRATYEIVKALEDAGAGEGRPQDKPFRFVYFSGELADPTEKNGQMWARVKGRTEKHLSVFSDENPGIQVHSIRPSFLAPSREFPEDKKHRRGAGKNIVDSIMGPLLRAGSPHTIRPSQR